MFRQWSPCVLFLLISPTLAARTWWVDATCDQYFKDKGRDFDKMMDEVFHTASMGIKRMSRTKEQEPQAYEIFSELFKYDPSSLDDNSKSVFRNFRDNWGGLSGWTKEKGGATDDDKRKASWARIYCDEDARFVLAPDTVRKFDEETPNSLQKDETLTRWWDEANDVDVIGEPSCRANAKKTDGSRSMASTYGGRAWIEASVHDATQAPERVTITLCKFWLDSPDRADTIASLRPDLFSILNQHVRFPPDVYGNVGSMLMLHEMMHHKLYDAYDHAYGWEDCVALSLSDASANADTYALFGIMMHGLDKKYTLDDKARGTWKQDDTIDTPQRKRRVLFCPVRSNVNANLDSNCREFTA